MQTYTQLLNLNSKVNARWRLEPIPERTEQIAEKHRLMAHPVETDRHIQQFRSCM